MIEKFKGVGVAIITPFTENKSIDFPSLEKLINYNLDNGVDYLVALGTTGEAATLSTEEKHEVLEFVVNVNNGRVPVVAGFGGNNTSAVIDAINSYHLNGIDAILSASPAYNKPSQEGIYQHYKSISETSPRPVILYNVPSRTSSNIDAETTLRLARLPNIIGIKEASTDLAQSMQIVKNKPDDFFIVSGDDLYTLPMISYGVEGVISVVANAFPKGFSELVHLALNGEFEKAREYQFKLTEIIDLLFVEGNPSGVKCALEILHICKSYLRLPMTPVSASTKDAMARAIEKAKLVDEGVF